MYKRIAAVAAVIAVSLVAVAGPGTANEPESQGRPPHDSFASAAVIAEVPYSGIASTTGSRLEAGEPQSSCGRIKSSVWYRFTAPAESRIAAAASTNFKAVMSVYSGTNFEDLVQLGCDGPGTKQSVEFKAFAATSYFVQIGSAGTRQGMVDLSLDLARWQEKVVLRPTTVPVDVPEINAPLVRVEGRSRADDPDVYVVSVSVAGGAPISKGVRLGRGIPAIGPVDALKVPAQAVKVTVGMWYRFDRSQQQCIVEDGTSRECDVALPLDTADPTWAAREGYNAELVIDMLVTLNGNVLQEQSVSIPLVGQAASLVP